MFWQQQFLAACNLCYLCKRKQVLYIIWFSRTTQINWTGKLSPVHSIDADAQLSVKNTALTQAASFDIDADADAGIEMSSIPASTSASASYCELGFQLVFLQFLGVGESTVVSKV